ncbi:Protein kinase-like domain protein [Niveomyces insectorum RCEF 264]|uniref:EKC/KEOPS complex subunit BUD32 n=1 Tax=Niveomyces insectorum RCEF 264 TaxID=1081102 RepID=A0A167ZSJ6_9HYPO|nr:Protein kinase-like domain protein [Niveomyces insectorum RCEF 264]
MAAGATQDGKALPRSDPWWKGWPVANHPPNAKTLFITGCGIIYVVPERPNELVKVPKPFEYAKRDHEIERRVYRRLGTHRNIVRVVDMDQYGIYLERAAHGSLREYFMGGGNAELGERILWCRDVAGVLAFVHRKGIRHADLSGRNLLIDARRTILLCDFAGSSIDGEKATILAESGFRHPDKREYVPPTIRAELHALGSTVFEIVTGAQPYQGLEDHEIDQRLAAGQYPDVSEMPLGDVVAKCWQGRD